MIIFYFFPYIIPTPGIMPETRNHLEIGISVAVLIAGLLFAFFYRRGRL